MTNNKEIDNYDLFGLKDEKNKLFYLNIKNLIDSYYKKIDKDIDFDIYKSINDEYYRVFMVLKLCMSDKDNRISKKWLK